MDRDKNTGPIRYYINYTTPISQAFEITDDNRETGLITLKNRVDRESYSRVELLVRAVDNGPNPLTSYATVSIEIEDVNDNSPKWLTTISRVNVSENASVGTLVTQLTATDDDTGPFSEVRYFITGGADGKFTIDQISVSSLK